LKYHMFCNYNYKLSKFGMLIPIFQPILVSPLHLDFLLKGDETWRPPHVVIALEGGRGVVPCFCAT